MEEVFGGAIIIKSNFGGCNVEIKGNNISVSGMLISLFQNLIENSSMTKEDIYTILKIANGEISMDSKEYSEFADKIIEISFEKGEE